MKKSRKMAAALARRQADYALMMSNKNAAGGPQQRKDTGGYHKPGSNQR